MLILEGPDGAGKTTLAEWLSEEMGWPIAEKIVGPDLRSLHSKHLWVENNLEGGLQPIIFDRHCLISEGVYAPITRGNIDPDFKDPVWYTAAQSKFRQMLPLVIFCLPPWQIVSDNVHDPATDNAHVMETIDNVYWAYYHLSCSWPGKSLVWDYTLSTDALEVPHELLMEAIGDWRVAVGL